MRISIALPIALFALLSLPAAGQDIFQPLRDMVEGITQKPEQAPRRPKPVVNEEAPPIPQRRPADLGGPEAPVVAEPSKPEVPEVAKPVPPVAPVVAQPGVDLPRERPDEPVEAPKPEVAPMDEPVPPAAEGVPEQAVPSGGGEAGSGAGAGVSGGLSGCPHGAGRGADAAAVERGGIAGSNRRWR